MHLTQKQNVQILTEQEHDRSEVSLDILSNKNSATEAENTKIVKLTFTSLEMIIVQST